MSGLNNLKTRIKYRGGDTEGRMTQDKEHSLKYALHNAYQAETAILADGREFKCLINPDALHPEYDNKIISIPFSDKCLTSHQYEPINMKAGDIFTWKETDTHWIVYLPYIEEHAYFRADILRCEDKTTINDIEYWVCIKNPKVDSIAWRSKNNIMWNDLNYKLIMYIPANEDTLSTLKRFTKIKITNPISKETTTWEVAGKNTRYGDGLIEVYLEEYHENSIKDREDSKKPKPVEPPQPEEIQIKGEPVVHRYDTVSYTATNFTEEGYWYVQYGNQRYKMSEPTKKITFYITKSYGNFTLSYETVNEKASLKVDIQRL